MGGDRLGRLDDNALFRHGAVDQRRRPSPAFVTPERGRSLRSLEWSWSPSMSCDPLDRPRSGQSSDLDPSPDLFSL